MMSNPTEKLKALFDWIITSDASKFIDFLLLNVNIEEGHKLELAGSIPNNDTGLISDCLNKKELADDIKNHIVENIDFTFDKFSYVTSQYFEQLDTHNRIKPTWDNIEDFYVEIGKLPMQMVNNHYVTLSDVVISDIPDNIKKQKEVLFFYNNELEIKAYKSYISILAFHSTDLTQALDWDKVLFLSDCSLLNVNETTISQLFSQLHSHDEEQNHQLIITMLEQYIHINQITEDLLEAWLFRQDSHQKTWLRTAFCKSIFKLSSSIKLQTKVFTRVLLKNISWTSTFEQAIPINKSLLLNICQNLESDELKSKLINEFFETITNNNPNYIRQFFATFSNEEWKILSVNSDKWVKLKKNQDNQSLYEKLLKFGLISLLSDKQLKQIDTNENTMYFKNNLKLKIIKKPEDDEDFID